VTNPRVPVSTFVFGGPPLVADKCADYRPHADLSRQQFSPVMQAHLGRPSDAGGGCVGSPGA